MRGADLNYTLKSCDLWHIWVIRLHAYMIQALLRGELGTSRHHTPAFSHEHANGGVLLKWHLAEATHTRTSGTYKRSRVPENDGTSFLFSFPSQSFATFPARTLHLLAPPPPYLCSSIYYEMQRLLTRGH